MNSEALRIQQLASFTGGKVLGDPERLVRHLATDSRSLPGVEHVLFIAIRGERHDGNDYVADLYNRGIRSFLTDREPDPAGMEEASFCIVADALKALQQLAGERRKSFSGKVVGITGSNGKTIVKEWISQMLQHEMDVVRSPRSYNSQLGVPLSLWQLSDRYDIAVIEAGISLPGEMEKLARIIDPDIGILTNIGPAHRENFQSDSEKLTEKLQLFRNCSKLIYRADSEVDGKRIDSYLGELNAEKISWALSGEALYSWDILEQGQERLVLGLNAGLEQQRFSLPFTDDASVENMIHAITLLVELGIGYSRIDQLLQKLEPVEMRLETLKGIHNSTLVNDVYNSDLAGLGVALDVLMQQRRHPQKVVILSDLYQSGLEDEPLYAEVAA
ncbi:MAG: Mur ligase domain-containing protein, partial [Bacteroidales bacterium]|nr:Mur ligase domain-containing protein [Bacteroidales bacterium]